MATPVEVPKLGNTVEECLISRWIKRQGDPVAAGDTVAEIETDKATFEVTAPVAGTLLATFFDEGALVPVFTNLFVIGSPGEAIDALKPGSGKDRADVGEPAASAPEQRAVLEPASAAAGSTANGIHLSPRARRFAREHDFLPSAVRGSGPNGRVLEADLRQIYTPAPKVSNIRERIARRMRESLANTAQYTLHASADAAALLALRASLAEININHLVTYCTIEALLDVPALNCEYVDGRIIEHSSVHLGFACDTPRSLLVPVIRNADTLALDELAARMRELTEQAVRGSIAPDDLAGATFTISNLGSLGIESFTPLLNPPQVAILGVGAIQTKPIRRQGEIVFIDAIGLSLTCDHQVIDGAPGARFLQVLKEKIQTLE